MPVNNEPRMNAVHMSAMTALRDSGLRNACTPFEIASTPLSATAPDENARINRKNVTPPSMVSLPVKCASWAWLTGSGCRSPVNVRIRPHTTSSVMIDT